MNIKMRIKQWLRDFLHPIVWDDLGLRVIKRELDDTWQVVQDLKYQVSKLMRDEDEILLKVLQNIKDKYYQKSETYFDENLEQLKNKMEEE